MRPVTSDGKILRVIGIDPGTHVCGWGVVAREGARLVPLGYGVVRAPERAPIERRLAVVAAGLREVVGRFAPTAAAIEEVFYGRDVRAAVRIGEGRGAALVVLAEAGVPVTGYANNVVKRAVTGAGRAGKEGVHRMVKAILGLAAIEGPLDASDALALAVCHANACGPAAAVGGPPAARDAIRGARGAGPGRLAQSITAAIEAQRARERARPGRRAR